MKVTIKLMNNLLMISMAVILIGMIFKIQHYPYGGLISTIGFFAYIIISTYVISRLKKIIADFKKEDEKVN